MSEKKKSAKIKVEPTHPAPAQTAGDGLAVPDFDPGWILTAAEECTPNYEYEHEELDIRQGLPRDLRALADQYAKRPNALGNRDSQDAWRNRCVKLDRDIAASLARLVEFSRRIDQSYAHQFAALRAETPAAARTFGKRLQELERQWHREDDARKKAQAKAAEAQAQRGTGGGSTTRLSSSKSELAEVPPAAKPTPRPATKTMKIKPAAKAKASAKASAPSTSSGQAALLAAQRAKSPKTMAKAAGGQVRQTWRQWASSPGVFVYKLAPDLPERPTAQLTDQERFFLNAFAAGQRPAEARDAWVARQGSPQASQATRPTKPVKPAPKPQASAPPAKKHKQDWAGWSRSVAEATAGKLDLVGGSTGLATSADPKTATAMRELFEAGVFARDAARHWREGTLHTVRPGSPQAALAEPFPSVAALAHPRTPMPRDDDGAKGKKPREGVDWIPAPKSRVVHPDHGHGQVNWVNGIIAGVSFDSGSNRTARLAELAPEPADPRVQALRRWGDGHLDDCGRAWAWRWFNHLARGGARPELDTGPTAIAKASAERIEQEVRLIVEGILPAPAAQRAAAAAAT